MIELGNCKVNQHIEKYASYKVQANDIIRFFLKEESETIVQLSDILYKDEFLIIINKPIGMVCESSKNKNYFLNFMDKQFSEKYPDISLLHRLDKTTTGVLMLTRTNDHKKEFMNLFRNQNIEKKYVAIVNGKTRDQGFINKPITTKNNKPIISENSTNSSQKAVTEFKKIDGRKSWSYLELIPRTGRTHQIRIHLKMMGFSIMGDEKYGRSVKTDVPRLMLHAKSIKFTHPIYKKSITVSAKIPEDFTRMLNKLRNS